MVGEPVVLVNRTPDPLSFVADGRHYTLQPGDNHGFVQGHTRFALAQNPLMGSEDYYTLNYQSKVGVKGSNPTTPDTLLTDDELLIAMESLERFDRSLAGLRAKEGSSGAARPHGAHEHDGGRERVRHRALMAANMAAGAKPVSDGPAAGVVVEGAGAVRCAARDLPESEADDVHPRAPGLTVRRRIAPRRQGDHAEPRHAHYEPASTRARVRDPAGHDLGPTDFSAPGRARHSAARRGLRGGDEAGPDRREATRRRCSGIRTTKSRRARQTAYKAYQAKTGARLSLTPASKHGRGAHSPKPVSVHVQKPIPSGIVLAQPARPPISERSNLLWLSLLRPPSKPSGAHSTRFRRSGSAPRSPRLSAHCSRSLRRRRATRIFRSSKRRRTAPRTSSSRTSRASSTACSSRAARRLVRSTGRITRRARTAPTTIIPVGVSEQVAYLWPAGAAYANGITFDEAGAGGASGFAIIGAA
jgi:hypothetical protein